MLPCLALKAEATSLTADSAGKGFFFSILEYPDQLPSIQGHSSEGPEERKETNPSPETGI